MANYEHPNVLSNTAQWFEIARPECTDQDRSTQLSVHFEEVAEMIVEITPIDQATMTALLDAKIALVHLSDHLKNHPGCVSIASENRKDFLDAIIDQIVTGIGCGHNEKVDVVGGLNAVNTQNFSKFEDGKPIYDANGKVAKGRDYQKADLTPFV